MPGHAKGERAAPSAGGSQRAKKSSAKDTPTVSLPGRSSPTAPIRTTGDLGDLDLGLEEGGFGSGTLDFIDDAKSKARLDFNSSVSRELKVRHRNGRVEGPYGYDRLKALIRNGVLTGTEDISDDGTSWRALTSDIELNAVLNQRGSFDAELTFGQVDLDTGDGSSIDLAQKMGPKSSNLSSDLDIGLGKLAPPIDTPAPPPSGSGTEPPSSLDELIGNLDLKNSTDLKDPHAPADSYPDDLVVEPIPEVPAFWEIHKTQIIGFAGAALFILVGIYTHFLTSLGAFGIPAMIEVMTYQAPPPAPPPPPPTPAKVANLEEVQDLIDDRAFESFRSAIATLEQAGRLLPLNAIALAKARVFASISYGKELFPIEAAQEAVATLSSIDPNTPLEDKTIHVEHELLKARAGLAILEGEIAGALSELKTASVARTDDPELAYLLGVALEANTQPSEAIAAYDRAIVAAPKKSWGYAHIGSLLVLDNNPDARIWFEKAVAANPKDARSAIELANLYRLAGRQEAADHALVAAARAASFGLPPKERVAILLQAIEAYDANNKFHEVRDLAKEAARLAPADPKAASFGALAQALDGDSKGALITLNNVLARSPNNLDALIARARTHMLLDNVANALLDLETARPLDSGVRVLVWLARFNTEIGKTKDATRNLLVAIRRQTNMASPRIELSKLALTEGDVDESHLQAEEAVRAEPGNSSAIIQLGFTQIRRGEFRRAETSFRDALELNKNSLEARLGLAVALRDQGARSRNPAHNETLARSVPLFLKCLRDHPDNPRVLFEYGRALEIYGDLEGAITLYERTAELDQKDVRPHLKMVSAHLSQTPPAFKRAQASLKRAQDIELKSGRQNAEVRFWEARIFLHANNTPKALVAIRRASEMEPRNAIYYYWLGQVLERSSALYESIKAYKRAIKLNSRYAIAHRTLGRAEMERFRFSDARENFNKYAQYKPNDPSIWTDIGESYSRQNKESKALEAFNKALRGNPRDTKALLESGYIHSRRGHEKEAQRSFQIAAKADPSFGEAWCALGLSLGERSLNRRAREALSKCLKFDNSPRDLVASARDLLDK